MFSNRCSNVNIHSHHESIQTLSNFLVADFFKRKFTIFVCKHLINKNGYFVEKDPGHVPEFSN